MLHKNPFAVGLALTVAALVSAAINLTTAQSSSAALTGLVRSQEEGATAPHRGNGESVAKALNRPASSSTFADSANTSDPSRHSALHNFLCPFMNSSTNPLMSVSSLPGSVFIQRMCIGENGRTS